MEQLEKRIKHHDKEIERMCNTYYQGFIDSIRDLQLVRNQAKNLNVSIIVIEVEMITRYINRCTLRIFFRF